MLEAKKKDSSITIKRLAGLVLVAVVLGLLIRHFVIEVVYPSSDSMEPTLPRHEFHWVLKYWYRFHAPLRGDIVMLDVDGQGLIKRVIALPGERIAIDRYTVSINGKTLDEPYVQHLDPEKDPSGDMPELVVPKDMLFVMGDNRDLSRDSRDWGPVPIAALRGKVVMLYR